MSIEAVSDGINHDGILQYSYGERSSFTCLLVARFPRTRIENRINPLLWVLDARRRTTRQCSMTPVTAVFAEYRLPVP
eukprot:scaffold5493_cov52-Attheya_sp.AAC.4